MMSIAFNNHQRDVMSHIPVADNDIIRYGSDIRAYAFSSPNTLVLHNLSVRSSSSTFRHPCISLVKMSGCNLLSMLPIRPDSIPAAHCHRPQPVHVSEPSHLNQLSTPLSRDNNHLPLTSHLSEPRRPIQLFIKSTRNTTISIHIDSTTSISMQVLRLRAIVAQS